MITQRQKSFHREGGGWIGVALILALVLGTLGCEQPTSSKPKAATVDKTVLAAPIAEAEGLIAAAVVGETAGDVPNGVHYVTAAEQTALQTALTAAITARDKPGVTQAEINTAKNNLAAAIAEFKKVRDEKTGTSRDELDFSALSIKITEAKTLLDGTTVSDNAAGVSIGQHYVTPEEKAAFQEAIAAAEAELTRAQNNTTSQATIAAAVTTLENAITAFNTAKTSHTGSKSYSLRFGVISDTHVGYTGRGNPQYPAYERVNKVVKWYSQQPGVKALAVVGDLTHNGYESEYDTFMQSWNANKGTLQLIAVMGNHDAYPQSNTSDYSAANRFETKIGQKVNAHYVIDGYHFIVINGGRSGQIQTRTDSGPLTPGEKSNTGDESNSFYAAIKDWTIQQIQSARTAAPGKPIFLFLHHPLKNTFYVSDEWYTAAFGAGITGELNQYPEVIAFGGHIHSPNNDPRSIWQGGFTSVNTVTTNYMEMEKAGSTAKYLGDSADGVTTKTYPKIGSTAAAQGMIVSVDGSRVTIENYDFDAYGGYLLGTGASTTRVEQIPQTWTFDVTKPAEFPYTQAKRDTQKTAPVFDASAAAGPVSGKIRVNARTETSVTVEFDQAAIPAPNAGGEVVHSYRFEFWKNGAIARTAYQWSDFMAPPYLQQPVYEQLIGGLNAGTDYELRIYAYGSFGAESSQYLTADITTDGTAIDYQYELAFNGSLANAQPTPASVSMAAGTPTYQSGPVSGKQAIKLNGDNYIQLDTAENPVDYNRSFTVAFWVKVLSTKGYDPVLFSNKNWESGNNNGFLFMVKNGGIRLQTKSVSDSARLGGSEDLTVASGVVNTWTHIAAVYDKTGGTNGAVRYYKNGVKVDEKNTNLTGGIGGGQRSYLAQSNNGSALYNGASKTYDVEFLMQDFVLKGGALSDADIAALANPVLTGAPPKPELTFQGYCIYFPKSTVNM
jgi:predicted phosphodiesterase